ncbi:MAG: 3'-5' exonuclease [Acidiferrobacteraceae bacterium]
MPIRIADAVFVVCDSETTGVNPGDVPVEIALVPNHPERVPDLVISTLVNPYPVPIHPEAQKTHGIRTEDLVNAPWWRNADGVGVEVDLRRRCEAVMTAGVPLVLVAHNAPFDRRMLGLNDLPWLCTMRLARHLYPEAENHTNGYLCEWLGLTPDLPPDARAHRAESDARTTLALLNRILMDLATRFPELLTVEALMDFEQRPAPGSIGPDVRVPFGAHKRRGETWRQVDDGYLGWVMSVADMNPDWKQAAKAEIDRRIAERALCPKPSPQGSLGLM